MTDKAKYVAALRALGIQAGDCCYCHADMTPFMRGKDRQREIIGAWAEALEEALPSDTATMILPTFCWDFYHGKVYDPATTPCNTGCLNETLRRRPEYARTKHPVFSHIVRGKRTNTFLETGMDAFGLSSVFGRLNGIRSKILFIGVPFYKCCTFVHFIEQLWGVPYREPRYFTGKVCEHGRISEVRCSHYARPADGSVVADFVPLETLLRNENYLSEVEVDGGKIGVVDAGYVFQAARKLLSENVESLIERKAKA